MAKQNSKKKANVVKVGKKSYNQSLEAMAEKIAMLEEDSKVLKNVLELQEVSFNVQMKTLDILKMINGSQKVMKNYV